MLTIFQKMVEDANSKRNDFLGSEDPLGVAENEGLFQRPTRIPVRRATPEEITRKANLPPSLVPETSDPHTRDLLRASDEGMFDRREQS